MKFRPCIDLHSGKVKQIVGSTLNDDDNNLSKPEKTNTKLSTNFETDRPASSFAEMYKRDELRGGHVIMLGPGNVEKAKSALAAFPNGLQIGGGINPNNAKEWLDAGASHVIVTSYVFRNGRVDYERLNELVELVGRDRLVLDLSCRRRQSKMNQQLSQSKISPENEYYVVTDRWQVYTDTVVNAQTLQDLSQYCSEFLVHGVENEGLRCGILEDLVQLLGEYSPIPVTYAGGVASFPEDLNKVLVLGKGKVDLTIGSALDCFGGSICYDDVVRWHKEQNGGND